MGGPLQLPSHVIGKMADECGFEGVDREDFTAAIEAIDSVTLGLAREKPED
ncbi:hypothetical protein ACSMXM_05440 [Pacificimonas sp. ICDLI1SI03]